MDDLFLFFFFQGKLTQKIKVKLALTKWQILSFFFFWLGFAPCSDEEPTQGMKLNGKEKKWKANKIAVGENLKKMSINSRIKEAKSNLEKTVTAS